MIGRVKLRCQLSERLLILIAIHHAAHVTRIPRNVLSDRFVGRSCNPVLGETTSISEDSFLFFLEARQHRNILLSLLKVGPLQVGFQSSCLYDLLVNLASRFAKEVVFEGHVTGVARQVLSRPRLQLFRLVKHRVRSLFHYLGEIAHLNRFIANLILHTPLKPNPLNTQTYSHILTHP